MRLLLLLLLMSQTFHSALFSATPKNPDDVHSFSNPQVAAVTHVDLKLKVDFDQKRLQGTALLHLARKTAGPIVLDTRSLKISQVEASLDNKTFSPVKFALSEPVEFLGQALTVEAPNAKFVRIAYETSPEAQGLQWLTKEQTAGKKQPFLFTQSEPTYARTWVPLQDSPGVRITYSAEIECPKSLRAVMSARQDVSAPLTGKFRFSLDKKIPPYLLALAVGDLAFQSTGPRTGVFAEPSVLRGAAKEFSDTERMIKVVEKLYGPYVWGRYDLLVLPPSFPFGGMENPLLTFATPTVIAGDKSLVSLVAHELAHSWSGNTVTNASWRDFWLNEGFTVYVENRIQEALFGKERAEMEFALECAELKRDLAEMKPEDTILHIQLADRDPEEGLTLVPYIKGALLLKLVEKNVGRTKFDAWLKRYFADHAFQSITTATFLRHIQTHLPNVLTEAEYAQWIEQPGLPDSAPIPEAAKLIRVDAVVKDYLGGKTATASVPWNEWTTQERVRFLEEIRGKVAVAQLDELEKEWKLNQNRNAEVRMRWLVAAVDANWSKMDANLESFLQEVGRRKLILPVYQALAKSKEGKEKARSIYRQARAGYHPISQASVDSVLR
jgi:leukotriene-A4 hydrolase